MRLERLKRLTLSHKTYPVRDSFIETKNDNDPAYILVESSPDLVTWSPRWCFTDYGPWIVLEILYAKQD